MAKFVWQDGTLVSKAKVEINGTIYEVDPEEYSGSTPLSASNLNAMVDQTYQDLKDYVDEKQTYSETETVIGTWFNKPLYRKSFQRTGNLSNITNTGITDLDEVIDLKVNVKSSSGNQWRTIPWIYNASSYDSTFAGGAYVNSTGSTIGFQAGSALTATSKYNITILYTKTTD